MEKKLLKYVAEGSSVKQNNPENLYYGLNWPDSNATIDDILKQIKEYVSFIANFIANLKAFLYETSEENWDEIKGDEFYKLFDSIDLNFSKDPLVFFKECINVYDKLYKLEVLTRNFSCGRIGLKTQVRADLLMSLEELKGAQHIMIGVIEDIIVQMRESDVKEIFSIVSKSLSLNRLVLYCAHLLVDWAHINAYTERERVIYDFIETNKDELLGAIKEQHKVGEPYKWTDFDIQYEEILYLSSMARQLTKYYDYKEFCGIYGVAPSMSFQKIAVDISVKHGCGVIYVNMSSKKSIVFNLGSILATQINTQLSGLNEKIIEQYKTIYEESEKRPYENSGIVYAPSTKWLFFKSIENKICVMGRNISKMFQDILVFSPIINGISNRVEKYSDICAQSIVVEEYNMAPYEMRDIKWSAAQVNSELLNAWRSECAYYLKDLNTFTKFVQSNEKNKKILMSVLDTSGSSAEHTLTTLCRFEIVFEVFMKKNLTNFFKFLDTDWLNKLPANKVYKYLYDISNLVIENTLVEMEFDQTWENSDLSLKEFVYLH